METGTYSFGHEAMTTEFEVIIAGQEFDYARQVAKAMFREIDYIERILSKYDPGSDVGQINLKAAGESVRVGIETLECLEIACRTYELSGGLFDPTIGTGYEFLDIDHENFTVGWKEGGKGELNLGGIGKGYAIDHAARILEDWDVEEVVINGGTSTVLALGKEWELGVGGPWGEEAGITSIKLKDRALSGSGTEVKGNHIKNPKTGRPARTHIAAWAVAPTAAESDALSTAFMMMDIEKIRDLVKKRPELIAFVVNQNESLIKIGV
jgi:thiamine biosynthesis lipoprotein